MLRVSAAGEYTVICKSFQEKICGLCSELAPSALEYTFGGFLFIHNREVQPKEESCGFLGKQIPTPTHPQIATYINLCICHSFSIKTALRSYSNAKLYWLDFQAITDSYV